MKIKISATIHAPATYLYVKVLTQDGKPLGNRNVMLCIPGGPGGNHTVYSSILAELLTLSDLILFDPRGCGYSDSSETQFCDLDHLIEDIDALRQYFNLSKITLLGGSYGAMAALGFAIRYGNYLEKLILIAGAPSYRFIETAKQNLKKIGNAEQIKIAEHLWNGTFKSHKHFKEYYKIMAPLYLYKLSQTTYPPPTIKFDVPYNIAITNFGFSNFLRKFDFEPDLQHIHCDTLILSGKNDWINDASHAIYMNKNIKKSTLILIDQCSHFIWEDKKEIFFESIKQFLNNKKIAITCRVC